MFRRRKPTDDIPEITPEVVDELDLPVKPGVRPAAAGPMRPPILPPRAPAEAQRAQPEVPRRLDGAAPPQQTQAIPPKREAEMRKLIVGRKLAALRGNQDEIALPWGEPEEERKRHGADPGRNSRPCLAGDQNMRHTHKIGYNRLAPD